jgi:hypothetical protein
MSKKEFLVKKKRVFLNSLRRKRAVFRRSVFLASPSRMEFVVHLFSNNITITLYNSNGNAAYSISASSLKLKGNRRSKSTASELAKQVSQHVKGLGVEKASLPILNCPRYHGIYKVAYESFCASFES